MKRRQRSETGQNWRVRGQPSIQFEGANSQGNLQSMQNQNPRHSETYYGGSQGSQPTVRGAQPMSLVSSDPESPDHADQAAAY